MGANFDLGLLSFESAEVPGNEEIRADAAVGDEVANPIHSKEFDDMQTVFDTYETITTRRYICRDDMLKIKELAGSYPSLEKLLKKFPVNSFSQEPSRINYDVSTESFIKSAYTAVVKALKDILTFIGESLRKFWDFLTKTGQQTAAVDGMEGKLRAIQTYLKEVDAIMVNTKVAEDYRKTRDAAMTNQYHNLTKRWTKFRQLHLETPGKFLEDLNALAGVITTKLPPYIDAVDTFLTEASKAETEQDIENAIAKIELFDMGSQQLLLLATRMGYSARDKLGNGVTPFQAQAGAIRGTYRGLINERCAIDREKYNTALTAYEISAWREGIENTMSYVKGRVEPTLKKIDGFNADNLKQGLEDAYMNRLVPSFKALTSILAGFTAVEQSMGLLTHNRNNVSLGIAKAALEVAKKIDQMVVANKSSLTIAEQNIIWRQRSALSASFGAEQD